MALEQFSVENQIYNLEDRKEDVVDRLDTLYEEVEIDSMGGFYEIEAEASDGYAEVRMKRGSFGAWRGNLVDIFIESDNEKSVQNIEDILSL